MRSIYIIILFVLVFSSCITDFNMKLDNAEPRLVVDGLITSNEGPYYVRLIKSNVAIINNKESENQYIDNAEAVLNALIIISDDYGQFDTLTPVDYNPEKEFLTYNRGYYRTNTIKGIPGHTYYLKIQVENKEYSAECYMPPVPEIDSVDYVIVKGEIGKEDIYIPRINFKEPQDEKNYYLINYFTDENYIDLGWVDHTLWQYFILSDEYLEPYVSSLKIEYGASPEERNWNWLFPGDKVTINLMSLNDETYNYYKNLFEQFDYDGGTYKPSPASPPTNIDNNALGFFRASALSQAQIILK